MTKLRGLLVPSPLWNPCSYLNWRANVFRESRYSSHYMGWEVAWAMVFLSWKWSKYSPGEISVVVIILGWTKFELLEEKKKIINRSATPPYDHNVNAVTLLLLPLKRNFHHFFHHFILEQKMRTTFGSSPQFPNIFPGKVLFHKFDFQPKFPDCLAKWLAPQVTVRCKTQIMAINIWLLVINKEMDSTVSQSKLKVFSNNV